jgi:hypothetical protein
MTFGRSMQLTGRISGIAGLLLLAFGLNYIDRLPNTDGSGFKWMLAYPLTGIFLVFSVPAILLSLVKKLSVLSALVGIAGIACNVLLWMGS